MFDKVLNPKLEPYLKMHQAQSLGELEKQQLSFSRGIEDSEREIKLLKAQIDGLLRQRPNGYAAKVEELKATQKKRQTSLETSKLHLTAIKQLIARKTPWFK